MRSGSLAGQGQIKRRSIFARKNISIPDLPKGYQISQYELPIVAGGEVRVFRDKEEKRVRLTRAHLEEDAGRLDELFPRLTAVDFNRAGTPLLEIVSEPELPARRKRWRTPAPCMGSSCGSASATATCRKGSFRCDANVSVRKAGQEKLGTRCEIKNSIRSAS